MQLNRPGMVSPMSSLMELRKSRRMTVSGMVKGLHQKATSYEAASWRTLLPPKMTATTTTEMTLSLHHEIALDLEF